MGIVDCSHLASWQDKIYATPISYKSYYCPLPLQTVVTQLFENKPSNETTHMPILASTI